MRAAAVVVVASLLGSATSASAEEWRLETTSYWKTTATIDALAIGTIVAGGFAEGEDGRDTSTSDVLFTAGGLTAFFGAPLVHLARGHGDRALQSLLMRGGLAGVGMVMGVAANAGCDGFLCQLDYVGYGMFGGLVLAAILDARLNTTERAWRPAWTPQLAASAEGVRVGAAWTW